MRPSRGVSQTLFCTFILACLLGGCTVVGPAAVRNGRMAYNEAIIETDNQQLLLAVVRNRYAERSSMLAVTSVTANVTMSTSANVEVGMGNEENYIGNLVPIRAGVIYEENPTISYTPVGGEKFARQLMAPVPLPVLAQLAGSRRSDPARIYHALVSSLNGLYNPDFLHASVAPDPRFGRAVAIMAELTRLHRLHWVQERGQGQYSIVIDHHAPEYTAAVKELLELLGLPLPREMPARVVLPVYLALDGRDSGGVAIITRSVLDLVEILSGAVEVTEQEQRDGFSLAYPSPGVVGRQLRIHRADARPVAASVAVRYRDAWFYIDDRDAVTKQYFRLLGSLYAVAIAEGASGAAAAPVLTVPVSR